MPGVYVVISGDNSPGFTLEGLFASKDDAESFARNDVIGGHMGQDWCEIHPANIGERFDRFAEYPPLMEFRGGRVVR